LVLSAFELNARLGNHNSKDLSQLGEELAPSFEVICSSYLRRGQSGRRWSSANVPRLAPTATLATGLPDCGVVKHWQLGGTTYRLRMEWNAKRVDVPFVEEALLLRVRRFEQSWLVGETFFDPVAPSPSP
jgi:hypothetical protein